MNKYSIILKMTKPMKCNMEIYDDDNEQMICTTITNDKDLDASLVEAKEVIEDHFGKGKHAS